MTDETIEKILTSLRSIDRAVVAARDALLERPQDAHTPRTAPQTRSGGTESGEGGEGAQEGTPQGDGLTDDELHARRAHPDWEYTTTTCGRKQGPAPEPEGDGWEPNAYIDMGTDPEGKPYPRRNWERFEYHDEEYWRRRRTPETKETAPELAISAENASPEGVRLASDQEDEPFVAASAIGDKLRALGVRFQRGVSNSDPANDEDIELSGYAYWVTVQGIEALAAEADGMTAERDEWKRRRDAAVQECRFLHQDGLSRRDWHAKHCGAMEAADTLRAKVERVRALADEWAAKAPADDWGDDMAETFVADAGRRILDSLDGADPR